MAKLRSAIADDDAIIFCTPEYAGALPGSVKNVLDWTVGGMEIVGKPAIWVNVAASGRAGRAHESLRAVLGFTHAQLVDELCVDVPVPRAAVSEDGTVTDPAVRRALADVVARLCAHLADASQ